MKKIKEKKKRRSEKRGLPPGSLVYIGEERQETVSITIMDYNKEHFEEKTFSKIEDCFPYRNKATTTWINISGIHNVELVEKIGKEFQIHPLLVEDILNSDHRPKLAHFGDNLLLILKRFDFSEEEMEIKDEQISILLGKNTIITFQENEQDDFQLIRKQIRESIGDIRSLGTDFLVYRLIDNIVDHYLIEMEKINDHIEQMEEEMVMNPSESLLHKIYEYKTEVIKLRKLTWPVREVILKLERREIDLIGDTTKFYFSDIYEHLVHMNDMVETSRSMLTGLLDIYFSSVSTKMNEIMKVLTMVSTIFIPLTFIAGIYGMNFAFMPELHWKFGYPIVLGIMVTITIIMLIYFRKKKWI